MKTLRLSLLSASFAAVVPSMCAFADGPVLPESLKPGLALWLSADKNVFEGTFHDKEGVIHWCDVREAFADGEAYADHASFSYPVASATTTTTYTNLKGGLVPPAIATDVSTGLKYIDFGDYGNHGGNNNWMFIENGSGALQPVTSRSLFAVVSFGTANNFGTVFGRIPALTSANNAVGYYWKNEPGNAGGAMARANGAIMQNGETRLNGVRINPTATTYGFDGPQVFSQVGPGCLSDGTTAPTFNTFFNDRNQGTITQGGGRLHEVLVYDRVLTWEERAAVEQYLSEKWLGKTFEVEVSGVTSPADVSPAEKATYDSAVAISLASLSNQVVVVSGAKATLCVPAAEGATDEIPSPFDDMTTNYVSYGSFEDPAQAAGAFAAAVPTGWTKPSGNTYLATVGSAIYNPTSLENPTIPDGNQCVGIQGGNGTIQQTITVPADGLYKVSFYMTRRPGRSEGANNTRAKVLIDGNMAYYGCVSDDPRGEQNLFKRYVVELPPLTKGQHTFALSLANNTSTDRAVLFDKVELSPVSAGEFVYIPNAGFESAGPVTYTENVGYDAVANNFGTDIFAWSCPTFYVDGNSCHARLAQNSQYYYWYYTGNQATDLAYVGEPPDERDYRKLVLVRAGYASQTIHVPRAGRLRFSMRYSRSYWGGSTGQKIAVMLGESEVARTDEISSVNTQTFVQDFDWSSAGDFTLVVTNVLGTSIDIATVVDDLRLEYVDNVVFDCTRPEGSGVEPAVLGDAESVSATLNVPSNGFYYAAVTVAGLAIEADSAAGVYNSYKYYPARAKVSVDGSDVAELVVETPDFTRLGIRLPYLSAGSHVIAVTGVGDTVATLGKVRVQTAELLPLSVADGAYDAGDAKFILNGGATLGLEFLGTFTCRGVKVGGTPLRGTVGAGDDAALSGPGLLDIRPRGCTLIFR